MHLARVLAVRLCLYLQCVIVGMRCFLHLLQQHAPLGEGVGLHGRMRVSVGEEVGHESLQHACDVARILLACRLGCAEDDCIAARCDGLEAEECEQSWVKA